MEEVVYDLRDTPIKSRCKFDSCILNEINYSFEIYRQLSPYICDTFGSVDFKSVHGINEYYTRL